MVDEEMTNFIRNLKRGTNNYKGMPPLKCYNCGKIGQFSSKCSYAKKLDSDEEEFSEKEKKYKKETRKEVKINSSRKIFYQGRIVAHQMRMMIVTVTH
jgi:hypothetical protein